jgi:hypothetical protein
MLLSIAAKSAASSSHPERTRDTKPLERVIGHFYLRGSMRAWMSWEHKILSRFEQLQNQGPGVEPNILA